MGGWSFGISEVTTWPWSFEQDCERYAALGAVAIEVWEFKLAAVAARRREQLRRAADAGLRVVSFQAQVHSPFPTRMAPDPAGLDARVETISRTIDALAPAIPGAIFVLNTGIAARGDVAAAFDASVGALGRLASRAADAGVRLALEPLHPLAMNEDSFVWTLAEARALVEAVGDPRLGICADAWNLAGQDGIDAALRECRSQIVLAQVADWRRPRSFLDRVAIGDGTLDLAPFLAGVAAAGYDGPLVLEIFSREVPDSLYDGDLHDVVARSREALTRYLGAPPASH